MSYDVVRCRCNWTHWFNGAVHIPHDVVLCCNNTDAVLRQLSQGVVWHRANIVQCRAQCEHRLRHAVDQSSVSANHCCTQESHCTLEQIYHCMSSGTDHTTHGNDKQCNSNSGDTQKTHTDKYINLLQKWCQDTDCCSNDTASASTLHSIHSNNFNLPFQVTMLTGFWYQ